MPLERRLPSRLTAFDEKRATIGPTGGGAPDGALKLLAWHRTSGSSHQKPAGKPALRPRHRSGQDPRLLLSQLPVFGLIRTPREIAWLGGRIPKWPTGADCKSAGSRLRWFESSSYHHLFVVPVFIGFCFTLEFKRCLRITLWHNIPSRITAACWRSSVSEIPPLRRLNQQLDLAST